MSGNIQTLGHTNIPRAPKKIDFLAGFIKQRTKCWHIYSVARDFPHRVQRFSRANHLLLDSKVELIFQYVFFSRITLFSSSCFSSFSFDPFQVFGGFSQFLIGWGFNLWCLHFSLGATVHDCTFTDCSPL